jgi:hypothetical protein
VHTASPSKGFAGRGIALDAASAVPSPTVSAVEEDSDGFKTVTYRKKTTTGAPVVVTVKHRRQPLIGVWNTVSLPSISKKGRFKAPFVSRFSPEVTTDDAERSLKEQLSLQKLGRCRLETKFNTYASFHVWVIEDEFPLINNIGVCSAGCLILIFMVSSPLIRCTSQLHPSLETQLSPIVLIGSAEVALIPSNNVRGLRTKLVGSRTMFTFLITKFPA